MKLKVIVLFSLVLFSSCLIQFVTTNYYSELDDASKQKIEKLERFNDLNEDKIYEITAPQLLNELKTREKSLVYIFKNGCSSENCLPLSTIQHYAEENDMTAYLIMNGYYHLDHSLDQTFKGPLFSINADHYESLKTEVYGKKFRRELGYYDLLEQTDKKYLGNYYFFKKDSLVDVKMNLNLE